MGAPDAPVAEHLRALVCAVEGILRGVGIAAPCRSEPWVDVATAAAHASCGEDTIREMIAAGAMPHGRVGTRGIRVRLSDVDRALLAHAAPESPAGVEDAATRIVDSLRDPP